MKRVLITGAAKGIGAAIARQCVERGHYVVAVDVDEERLTELESRKVRTAVLDVRDLDAWEHLVSDLETRGEEIDVLINNAGVCLPGRCDRVSPYEDRLTVEVNLIGVMNGIRVLLPRFLERRRGHVINVASMAAFSPAPDLAAYCATKHAVRAYTHSCALDHRHAPIDWTVVCPSAVETPMLAGMRKRGAGAVVFTETPMPVRRVATAVVDAIQSPRSEVLIPRARGSLLRLLGLFPGLLARGMDAAERRGRAKLDR